MSDKRKKTLGRRLFSLLPTKLRHHLMRNQLKLCHELDPKFSFRIARTQEELAEAYRILHESYVDVGYSKPNESGMRIIKYFALPSTTTLIALYEEKVVGTISIIRRNSFGLPMESAYDLSEFIERSEVIAEISSLAIDARFRQHRGALFIPLLKYFWQYVQGFMKLDSMVITVNPSMNDFYEGFLGFTRLKKAVVSQYQFANGNPGVGLYLRVDAVKPTFKKFYGHKPAEKNLYSFFFETKHPHFEFPLRDFYKSSDPVMTAEMLNFFFVQKSSVFNELTTQEKLGLSAVYPIEEYKRILPQVPPSEIRKGTRFSVNLNAINQVAKEKYLTILDVSNQGVCVRSPSQLEGIVLFKIQIAPDVICEVRGEVKWQDPRRGLYGIKLLRVDSHWNDFVQYMARDFEVLNFKMGKKRRRRT